MDIWPVPETEVAFWCLLGGIITRLLVVHPHSLCRYYRHSIK